MCKCSDTLSLLILIAQEFDLCFVKYILAQYLETNPYLVLKDFKSFKKKRLVTMARWNTPVPIPNTEVKHRSGEGIV